MSSEKENIELKSKEKNNTDKLNLSGQIVRHFINHSFLTTYKRPDKRAGQIEFVRVIFLAHFCLKTMGYDAKIYELQGRNL